LINNLKLIDSIDLDEFKKNIKYARESKKITIEQASKTLHIEQSIIEKLEDGNFEKISIDIFVLGHIRTYLNWIGIDPKLLINENKTENISLNQTNHKIALPYAFKISKLYISIIALALFILILIFYNSINTLEIEEDILNKNIEKDETLINKEKNNNPTQEISKTSKYSNETDNFEEKVKSEEISQNLKEEEKVKSEEISQNLKEEEKVKSEEISQNLKEEEKVKSEEISQNLKEEEKVEYDTIDESKIIKGDTILGLLKNVKWSIKEAREAVDAFSTIYDPKKINAGMAIIFPKDKSIKAFAITINKKTAVVITKMENENFLVQKKSLEKAREIVSSSTILEKEEKVELEEISQNLNEEKIAFISIKAIADSWIEIQKVNSNFFVSKIIKEGEELKLSYEKDLILATSNAGGIIIHIKDKIIDKIGKPGEVIRDISLNYDNLIKFIEE